MTKKSPKKSRNGNTIVLGGTSHLPKELSEGECLQITVLVDKDKLTVRDLNCTHCPRLIEDLLKQLMIGMHLEKDLEMLLSSINSRVHYRGKKAVLAAIRELMLVYREFRDGPTEETAALRKPQAGSLKAFDFKEARNTDGKSWSSDPDNYFNR